MDADKLDDCHRCEGLAAPEPVRNDPGLPALRYRVDVQPGFYTRMLQSLPIARADASEADSPRPLARLLSRSSADPSVALINACACVADVLTFYQERIANEGFLRTATERRSVLELARTIGYELKPGVAASVHLAFTVEDAPGAPGMCTLARGAPVQSVPPQGKLPQVFETSAEIVAHADWNALLPRPSRPADMALLEVPVAATGAGAAATTRMALVLIGPRGSFPAGSANLHLDLGKQTLCRLDPDLSIDDRVDAIEVGRVYFTDATTGIAGGDLILFSAKSGVILASLVLRAVDVVAEPALKRMRVDLEPLPVVSAPLPPPYIKWVVPYAIKPVLSFARAQIASVPFTSVSLTNAVTTQAWRERDLQAMIGIQRWSATSLVKAIATPADGPPIAPEAGAFAFGAKLGFFGNNAPRWAVLPKATANVHGDAYPAPWDKGDPINASGGTLDESRTIWQDSQGNAIVPHTYLERAVPNVNRAGWVVFDAPDQTAKAYSVFDARETSRADYGLSGRAMALTLAGSDGGVLEESTPPPFRFRSSTAHVASRKLPLADLPIETPIAAGDTAIELDRMVLGLTAGQPIALTGERDDLPGVDSAEIAVLDDIVHADGRSTLMLHNKLLYSYRRSGLKISANVVHATQGESVAEVLGSGDASQPHQSFMLKKPPTTFLSAPTPKGVQSTLELRVGGVRWDEVDSLYGVAPDAPVYATRIDNDARMHLIFGDGVQGARLPTGTVNVAARYRSGIGPDGDVDAGTLTMLRAMPLGLRGVTNPVPAAGAEGPEQLADARRNAPLTLLTFERVVSLLDYQDYARAYPGIGKARADVLWTAGANLVHLTVAGATGDAPGDDVMANLPKSIAAASDQSQHFAVAAYVQRYFSCVAQLAIDPRYRFADVQTAVAAVLLQGFGFAARDLGQSVTAAEVITLIHTVAGVLAVDLMELRPYADGPPAASVVLDAVPAFGAFLKAGELKPTPAELLLINPAALSLTEMPA